MKTLLTADGMGREADGNRLSIHLGLSPIRYYAEQSRGSIHDERNEAQPHGRSEEL